MGTRYMASSPISWALAWFTEKLTLSLHPIMDVMVEIVGPIGKWNKNVLRIFLEKKKL